MNPVFELVVTITGFQEVKGHTGEAAMLLFDVSCESELFQGKGLPGSVDTQKQPVGGARTLSARYVLHGTDRDGRECNVFIENNGQFLADGSIVARPLIYTDSEALAYLETADLSSTVEPTERENEVLIRIFVN